jgi:hypothetical protein
VYKEFRCTIIGVVIMRHLKVRYLWKRIKGSPAVTQRVRKECFMGYSFNVDTSIYRLIGYSVTSVMSSGGGSVSAMAELSIARGGETLSADAGGNGPVDAALNAIVKIIDRDFELKEFQITATGEGTDAMGETNVKLHSAEETFSGSGRLSDIVGASILAYLSAVNKIILKEAENSQIVPSGAADNPHTPNTEVLA